MTTTDTLPAESPNARIAVDARRSEAVDALVQALLELLQQQRHTERSGSESLDGDA